MSMICKPHLLVFCLSSTLALSAHANDQLGNMLKQVLENAQPTAQESTQSQQTNAPEARSSVTKNTLGADLATADVNQGLQQMLLQSSQQAISALGQKGGFLNNPLVKIPLPDSLSLLDSGLRKMGQGQYIDDFVKSMNTAAEKAVPEAAEVFAQAIENMSPQDALSVLNGGAHSVTEYFKKSSSETLKQRFAPLIKQATDSSGVTTAYKSLMAQTKDMNVGGFNIGNLLSGGKASGNLDLDQYVTDKSLEGLFKIMAEEEAKIRSNPTARATDLLKQIFGG